MAEKIPSNALDLFQKPALAHVATIMPDGTPQVTPVWVSYDGENVLINTGRGRQKELNLRKHPQVGLDIVDPSNPFHWVSVRGHVAEITEHGANEHINQLSKKYTGNDQYQGFSPTETRVIIKIVPDRVIAQ
jgi:PPOX class probable F420-dependent enzyme